MPLDDVGIEHVPVVPAENLRADLRLRLDQPLCGQGLQSLAQGRSGNAEKLHQLRIARERGSGRKAPLHDALADAVGDEIVSRAPSRQSLNIAHKVHDIALSL